MIKTTIIFAYFWAFLLFSVVFIPIILFLSLPGLGEGRKRFFGLLARFWAKQFLWLVGAKVEVQGRENIPIDDKICFIGNHQSIFDILLILAYSGKTPGFIAKKELYFAPILNFWMRAIHCVFIDRQNPRKSVLAIERGVESLKKGHPMVIFPEGTRNRNGTIGEFKAGSFKLATRAEAIIVPVSIVNTASLYEKEGRFRPAKVRLVFHPPIPTEGLSPEGKKNLPVQVREQVLAGFSESF